MKDEMDVLTCAITFAKCYSCLGLPLPPVETVPEAAAHDKEPRVSIPITEEEERVSALAGGSAASGIVWEWGAQVWEWQPQETAGGPAEWGERPD